MKRFFSSLRFRLLCLVVVAVLPVGGLLVHAGRVQRRQAGEAAHAQALGVARLAAAEQSRLIAGTRQYLAALAQVPALREADPRHCDGAAREFRAAAPQLTNISVVSLSGDVVCSGLPMPGPVNVADRGYFRLALATREFAVGEYAIGRASGRASLFVASPVLDRSGGVARVITAGLDLGWLNRLAAAVPLPQGSALSITDASGMVLARHPDPEIWVGRSTAHIPVVKALRARPGERIAEEVGLDGVARLYAFAPLAGAPGTETIHLGVGIPRAVAFAEADRLARRNLILLAVATALMLSLAWVGADLLVLRPGRRLLQATRRAAAGDFTGRSGPPYGAGEVGELERAFDEMTATLHARQVEAEAAREALVQSEARHRMLVEQAADGIIVFDRSGRLLEANPRACELLGYSREEILRRAALDLLAPEAREASAEGLRTLLATGALTVERLVLRKDGSPFPAELRDRRLPDGTFQAVIRDLTAQKVAESRARALAEAGRALMGPLDLRTAADVIATLALKVLAGRRAAVYGVDEAEPERLVCLGGAGDLLAAEWVGQAIPLRISLTGFAAAERRPATSANVRDDPRFEPGAWGRTRTSDDRCHAWASVPLIVGGELVGALSVGDTTGRQFTSEEVDLLAGFAGSAALALRNARLFARSERRRREAEALADAARDLTGRLDVAAVADRVVRGVQSLLGCPGARVRLLRPDGGLVGVAFTGPAGGQFEAGNVIPPGQGLTQRAIAEGRTLQAPDLMAEPGLVIPDELQRRYADSGQRAILSVPLQAGGTVIGALNLSQDTGWVFSADEVRLAQAFADQAALALHNARLYEEAELRRHEAEAAEAEARRATAALSESEASLEGAQARARLGSWEYDLKARRARWSREMFRLYGRDPAVGEPGLAEFLQYIHPDDRGVMSGWWTRTLRTGEPASLDYRTNPERGPVLHFNTTIHRLTDGTGEPVSLAGTVLDVTERARAEQEIRALNEQLEQRVRQRTAQLEEVNAEMEAFAYSVAHDLRAPLRAMQGLSQALLEDYGARLDATGREYAERVVRAAESMDGLIRDLLAYGRLSRTEIRLEPVRWASVVDEARRQLEGELGGAAVEARVPESLPGVAAHRATLAQVVANLLGNAVKFVAPGVTPRVCVWAEERGERIRLWVEDNGIGIAPEHQERIFRVFERLHGRESYPGTGIGLAIVRKGMERMGGGCGVESAPGQGSRLWVDLPRA